MGPGRHHAQTDFDEPGKRGYNGPSCDDMKVKEEAMDWHELEKMKVTDLREMAKEKLELVGTSGLNKDELVATLAKSMGIEKPHKVARGGVDKTRIKQEIRALKLKRSEALLSHDHDVLHTTRHEIHKLKRKLRKMARLQG